MVPATKKHTTAQRLTLTAVATATVTLFTAGPAFAHVEVESEKAQALAENVEVSFAAESESNTAGITELRVVLPEGIAPTNVTYGEGPKGWKLTATDDGYTVEGPALQTGENAKYSVVVRQLPDVKELAFKTLQTYSDGSTDRWIELGEGSEQPAPVLKLKPAAPDAKPASPSPVGNVSESPSQTATAEDTVASASPAAAAKTDDGGLSTGAWIGIGAAVVVVAGAGAYLVRRRAGGQ